MGKIYYEQPKVRSKCIVCGDDKVYTYKGKGKHKNKTFEKPFYYKMFEKVGWFRGDDDYLGRICKNCTKLNRRGRDK